MEIEPNLTNTNKPWYRKTWGILSLFGGSLIILVAVLFLVQVMTYTNQINLGNVDTEGFSKTDSFADVQVGLITREQLETRDDPMLGNPEAAVVIVEFGDFQCPFCKNAFPTVREMQTEFKDQVLFIWRDMPLRDIHPQAQKAAEAGECAHEQGKFWEYHDKLFINQTRLGIDDLKDYARQVGLNGTQFDLCLDSNKYAFEVEQDLQDAMQAGVQGTPTFFINGQLIAGVIPRDTFRQIIIQLLSDN